MTTTVESKQVILYGKCPTITEKPQQTNNHPLSKHLATVGKKKAGRNLCTSRLRKWKPSVATGCNIFYFRLPPSRNSVIQCEVLHPSQYGLLNVVAELMCRK